MDMMKDLDLELFDCPICHGAGLVEEEEGWCVYAVCLDCGAHTAEVPYKNETERENAYRRVVNTWNIGKVIPMSPGE